MQLTQLVSILNKELKPKLVRDYTINGLQVMLYFFAPVPVCEVSHQKIIVQCPCQVTLLHVRCAM